MSRKLIYLAGVLFLCGCNSNPSTTGSAGSTTGSTGSGSKTLTGQGTGSGSQVAPANLKENLARIGPGTKRAEVVQLLGPPEGEEKRPNGTIVLTWKTKAVQIFLDREARVATKASPWDEPSGSVAGTVAVDGQPLRQGKVVFHPNKGKPVAVAITDGDYTATNLPPGTLTVTIEVPEEFKKFVNPVRYSDPKTSLLRVTVEPGPNRFDIQLRSS